MNGSGREDGTVVVGAAALWTAVEIDRVRVVLGTWVCARLGGVGKIGEVEDWVLISVSEVEEVCVRRKLCRCCTRLARVCCLVGGGRVGVMAMNLEFWMARGECGVSACLLIVADLGI